MKFCSHCGNELMDEAVICPGCGCPIDAEKAGNGLATASLICAFLVPIAGIICGIIGAIKYKAQKAGDRCIVAIMISIAMWIISATILMTFSSWFNTLLKTLLYI